MVTERLLLSQASQNKQLNTPYLTHQNRNLNTRTAERQNRRSKLNSTQNNRTAAIDRAEQNTRGSLGPRVLFWLSCRAVGGVA